MLDDMITSFDNCDCTLFHTLVCSPPAPPFNVGLGKENDQNRTRVDIFSVMSASTLTKSHRIFDYPNIGRGCGGLKT